MSARHRQFISQALSVHVMLPDNSLAKTLLPDWCTSLCTCILNWLHDTVQDTCATYSKVMYRKHLSGFCCAAGLQEEGRSKLMPLKLSHKMSWSNAGAGVLRLFWHDRFAELDLKTPD